MKSKIKVFGLILGVLAIIAIVELLAFTISAGFFWLIPGCLCGCLGLINIIAKKPAASDFIIVFGGCILVVTGIYMIFDGQKYTSTVPSITIFIGAIFFAFGVLVRLKETQGRKEAKAVKQKEG